MMQHENASVCVARPLTATFRATNRFAVTERNQPVRSATLRAYRVLSPPRLSRTGKTSSSMDHDLLCNPVTLSGQYRELADTQSRVRELEAALAAAQKTIGVGYSPVTNVSDSSTSPASQSHIHAAQSSVNYIPDTYLLDTALAAFQWHLAYCGLGASISPTRTAFYSTIQQQTGLRFDLDDFLSEVVQSFHSQCIPATKRATSTKWPPTPLVQRCINHYAKAGLYSMFPFADVDALQMLVNADVLGHPKTARAAHRACLAAFTANITQMHRHEPAFAGADPDAYGQAGLSLISEILIETPDLRTLEALLMLVSLISPIILFYSTLR